jgi:hypothetical protein
MSRQEILMSSLPRTPFRLALFGAAALALALPAMAEDGERVPPVTHAATLKECGECHMAFQPALLPAQSWRTMMAGLKGHFGEDASLEAEMAADIEAYLVANAGWGDGRLLKISEQRWFRHEHDFSPAVWQKPEIRSPANCEACHQAAAKGIYDEPEGRAFGGEGRHGLGHGHGGDRRRGDDDDD